MDRVLNPKDEKTIYEIYRACRLCGAGAGYKMPIIQSVVDLESHGLELRQKIKECIQIEVNHTDRMPPLICELCVDKVNDFYDFFTLCRETNNRTRQRLGLPLQTRDTSECKKCKLGLTQSIISDSDVEHVSVLRSSKARVMKEPAEHVKIKIETKKEICKVVTSKKKDTMLQEMAEKAKKEVSMLRDEGGLLMKEGSMLTKKAKRGSKQALEDIQLGTLPDKKIMKVIKSKYKKKEKENGRSALCSATPEGGRAGPASKRSTRQNTDSTSIDVQLIYDTPLPDAKITLKRPRDRDVRIDTPPATKKVRLPEPRSKDTSKPGPNSKRPTKDPEPPKPALKEPEPPKPTYKPRPASKKETKPSPPTSKPSKTKSKPEPVKTRPEPVKTRPEPVKTKPEEPVKTKPAPKFETKYNCGVCGHQVKTHQGLYQHNVMKHAPTFTAAKLACNACELWFPTLEECAAHHRTHRDGLPYKCHRCYGYFKLQQEYESHFAEKLCLSVYEVPDVQCWRCCHRFATSALLSAHRCPGEEGRPGGKCSKCGRSYALLKNQLKHEAACNYKKKGEVRIKAEVQSRLLAMQVKLARCDALLTGPRVNVAAISHKYGLDSKAHYPYLPDARPPTKAMLKANHMVSIDDAVKVECWGSDSNDSQKVDSLTSISLKTINRVDKSDENDELTKKIFNIIDNLVADDEETCCDSDKLLEKDGDRRQSDGEAKCEKGNDSDGNDEAKGDKDINSDGNDKAKGDKNINSDGNDEAKGDKDINSDGNDKAKGDENINSDGNGEAKSDKDIKSDGNDKAKGDKDVISVGDDVAQDGSDSVLDNIDKKTEDSSQVNDESNQMEVVKDVPESVVSADDRDNSAVADVNSDATNVDADSVDVNIDADNMDVDDEKVNVSPEKTKDSSVLIDDSEKMDVDCEKSDVVSTQNDDGSSAKSEDILSTELDKRLSRSENEAVDDKDQKYEDTDVEEKKDDANSSKEDNDLAMHKTFHSDLKTSEDETCKKDCIKEQISIETSQSTEENANDEENSKETLDFSAVNDNCSKNVNIESSNEAMNKDCSKAFNKDKFDSDGKEPDNVHTDVHETEKIDVNQGESYPPLMNNEVFSKIDEITNKILKETGTTHDNTIDEHSAIENTLKSDNHSDSISLNSLRSVNNTELQDKYNVDDLSDDEKKLMAEIDAQIGESHENHQKKDDITPNDASGNDSSGNNFNDNSVNDTVVNKSYGNVGYTDTNSPAVNSNSQNGPSSNQINGSTDQKSKDYLIDNLLRKQEDLKSLELDSISDDEFNFD